MKRLSLSIALIAFSAQSFALEISSTDIKEGQLMPKKFEYQGMGCNGGNVSPQLSWSDAPKETKSFAITVFDPDAPTGSGWWHWTVLNLPASTLSLPQGASGNLKTGLETRIDYGKPGFGGACPPKGDGMHRYQFTVWALPEAKLELPADISPAIVGFTLNKMALDKAVLTATYVR
ncbi:YbhB/YbcL family Raf kinase inhibitor-like protein [Shewanella sp. Choline-02u-19]|uniref:YbhB/YbcL family Raf kinase inhibitor-like protein n=1 Tax=unclassified Shewanella TaxID=196818 RepID=UPI000C3268FA|nr:MULTISPECIES: YbhB/YbcL family Raf kinase inhibitor-like protein [unclassified Shewanella]PKH57445.1 YbhB/YbcL family Raf kinase inhibitor-like protein [Shewanella sp. Bg11-22]PKI28254.1 YbhB/YbcL family Raf kinase inhibitor-like protein [Shewanella sp. Choline-02u-19]